MADFDLDDLVNPLTVEEVQSTNYTILDQIGANTTTWKPGAVTRGLITSHSYLMEYCTHVLRGIARMGFLAYAAEDWLTLVARHVYNVERNEAAFATGNVTLTNNSATPYSLAIDDLIVSAPALDKEYRNSEAVTIPAMGSVQCVVQAVEAGSASTATPGQINALVTSLNDVEVTNPASVVGFDQESDAELRARCRASTAALSPFGPSDAYRYAATNATRADGSSCGVTSVRLDADGQGNIDVYLRTATGGVPGTVGDLDTDLGRVSDAIQRNAVPLGITANVASVSTVPLDVEATVYVYDSANLSDQEVITTTSTAISDRIARLPIGGDIISTPPGKLYLDSLRGCIDNSIPQIYRVVLANPVTDITLAVDEIIVVNSVDTTVVQTPSPDGALV